MNYKTTKNISFLNRKDITMKKLCKFALLLLSVLLMIGVLAFTVTADEAATVNYTPTATAANGVQSYPHVKTGNYGTSGLNNASMHDLDFGYTAYTMTRADGTNYLELVSQNTMNTEKHFQFVPFAKELYTYDASKNQYGVFDFDIATETDLTYLSFVSNIRKGQSTSDHTYTGGAVNLYFNSLFTAEREKFMHVTVIQDLTGMMQYIFINNIPVHQTKMIDDDSHALWKNGEIKLLPSFKLQMHKTYTHIPPLTENQTVLIDNLQYNYFAYGTSSDALSALLNSGIDSWQERIYNESYVMPEIPDIVEIDGVRYKNIYDANDILMDGGKENKEVKILRSSCVPLSVGCNATVYSNGNAFDLAAEYGMAQIEENVYKVDNSARVVTVKINGVEVCKKNAFYGTVLGTLFGDETLGKTVIFGNGKAYRDVTWNGVDWDAPISGDTEIVGTGTEVTTYIAHNGASVISTSSLSAALSNSSATYIILGGDIKLTSAAIIINGTKNIYINDRVLTQDDGTNHSFTTNNSTNAVFYGPGTINNLNTSSTYSLIATMQNNTSSVVEFNDLTINTSHYLSVIRDGKLRFNNCECNVFSAHGAKVFAIGEKSTGGVTVDLVGTSLNFTHSSNDQVEAFRQIAIDTDLNHTLNIIDSVVIAQTTLFHMASSNNMTVNVSNSSLVAKYLVSNDNASSATHGAINFINNVYVNSALQNLGKANLSGLTTVKSNNHLAPICYSNDYATVTWWNDNTVELWASGSTPVKQGSFVPVSTVEPGTSYTFGNPYKKAPFSLKGNLTLGSEISFNLYVTRGKVNYVTANKQTIYPVQKSIDGTVYDTFSVKLSPKEAVSAFDVFFTLKDGNTVARTISVLEYAKLALANYDSVTTRDLIVATLGYIKAGASYFGVNTDLTQISNLITAYSQTTYDIPTSVTNTNNGDISAYFTGVQLDLADTLKMRFNIASGASITSLIIQINGRDKEYQLFGSYVEIDLRAYEMAEVITITVNGVKRDYSLAEYLIGAKTLASGTTSYGKQCTELFKDTKGNLASAIYSYALAARSYMPML